MKVKPLLNKVNSGTFLQEYLVACGVKEDEVEDYIDLPSCEDSDIYFEKAELYPNIDKACAEIKTAVEKGEKIAILADADGDGTLSSAIMYKFLKGCLDVLKDNLVVFLHTAKQHGLKTVENLVQQVIDSGSRLLIVPDAGSSDNEPCMVLKQNNVQTICADHHETTPTSNNYATVVNHHLGEGLNTTLSGTGVTFKLIERYCELFLGTETIDKVYREFTPFVAISLISDVCDMTSLENRAFFIYGVDNLSCVPELWELVMTLNYKGETDPHGFSFGLIPPINALCRSNDQKGKRIFFESLVGERSIDDGIEILRKAVNEQRKAVDEIMGSLTGSNMDNDHKATVAFIENEQANYSGLVANKVLSNSGKPTFVLRPVNPTQYSGSLRSPFPISDIINKSRLAKAEGHLQAAGLILPKANLKKLLKYLDSHLTNDIICDTIDVTARIAPKQITTQLCYVCENNKDMWGSSGSGIVEPTFYVKFTAYSKDVNIYRKKTNTGKISAYGVDFIKFKLSEEDIAEWTKYDKFTFEAIVTLCTNEWNGRVYPQAMIQQWEVTPINKVKSLAEDEDWRDLF